MEKGLYGKLAALREQNVLPMHMPGHKRNTDRFPWLGALGADSDVTEIAGFDDLHSPQGAIKDILRHAERLWHARRSFLSVNGSTGAVFAALAACGEDGVLIARNCHRSVFNAAAYLRLRAEFADISRVEGYGFFGDVDPQEIGRRLDETGCKAVVITSPTYEGVQSDVTAIAKEVHARGAVLVVDAAHGAHLGLNDSFPKSGEGADVEILSLHKTLPALTQTALLNVMTCGVDEEKAAAAMSAFITSSPSYILMTSVEKCLDYLDGEWNKDAEKLARSIESFRARARGFGRLHVFDGKAETRDNIYATDTSKIYIDCKKCRFDGFELKRMLRENYAVELECAYPDGVLAYVTAGDDERSLSRLYDALAAIDKEETSASDVAAATSAKDFSCLPWTAGEAAVSMGDVMRLPYETLPLADAVGRVSAESVWAYPPGVPVILPGERVTRECVKFALEILKAGGEVASSSGGRADKIRVLRREPGQSS